MRPSSARELLANRHKNALISSERYVVVIAVVVAVVIAVVVD